MNFNNKQQQETIISVIMPVYNTEKFVGEAIESILYQSFQDFEFIIIDDASTDSSYQICEAYAKNDSRIRLYRNKENKGISYTRNKLIGYAKTNYIASQDSDDISEKNRLRLCYHFFENNLEYAVVSGNNIIIDELGNIIGKREYSDDIQKVILKKSPISQPSSMFRKNIFHEVGGYDKKLNYGEDYDLWLKFFSKGYKIKNLSEDLLQYRIRKGQTKSKKLKDTIKNTIFIQKRAIGEYGIPLGIFDICNMFLEYLLLLLPGNIVLVLFQIFEYNRLDKVKWILGPSEYDSSGIGKYSNIYIKNLKKELRISLLKTNFSPKSIARVLWSYIYVPLILIFDRKSKKVFYEEGWLPILFYPLNNIIFIIHDVRDFSLTTNNAQFIEKIYFWMIKISFKKINNKKVSKVICPSYFTRDKLVQIGVPKEKIKVIYNPINEDYQKKNINNLFDVKNKIFKRYGIPFANIDKKIILNVGTEESRKNIINLLRALGRSHDYVFLKIGDPVISNNREENMKFISENDINCFFIPKVQLEELIEFYSISDLYINTSLFEGFGRTVIEAQACGLPVLSTINSGLKEVLEGISFYIENPYDIDEISNKIKLVLGSNDIARSLVSYGNQNYKRFLIENNYLKWKKVLQS